MPLIVYFLDGPTETYESADGEAPDIPAPQPQPPGYGLELYGVSPYGDPDDG